MTNEKFEQLLRHALAPEIDDREVFFQQEISLSKEKTITDDTKTTCIITYEKARSLNMKTICKITAIAACAALILGVGTVVNEIFRNQTFIEAIGSDTQSSKSNTIISSEANPFMLKVGAEEIITDKGVPLTFKNGSSASLGGSEDDGSVKYCISAAGFICEGEGIETVTYSINKGAFAVVEAHDSGSLISSGTPYDGDTNFPGYQSHSLDKYDPKTIDTSYYTEYTLDYSSQQSDRLCVNICGEVYSKELFYKVFDSANTPETKAEGNTELMKDVEITCTAHYADGTTDSKTVVIECQTMTVEELGYPIAPDDDPNRKEATFVYKLK